MTSFGEYTLLCPLAESGHSSWYAARRRQRHALLRIVSVERATQPDWTRDLRRNILVATNLQHPALLNVYDAGEREGRWFLAYEPALGLPLDQVLKDRRLDRAIAAVLGMAIIDALTHLARMRVRPGPLVTDRVWCSFDGRFLLADAGLDPLLDPPATKAPADPEMDPWLAGLEQAAQLLATLTESEGESEGWTRALDCMSRPTPEDRNADEARYQLATVADPNAAMIFARRGRSDVVREVTTALENDRKAPPPPPGIRGSAGAGHVAGATALGSVDDFTLTRRLPTASPLALYQARRHTRIFWLRLLPSPPADTAWGDAFERERELAATLKHRCLPEVAEAADGYVAYDAVPTKPFLDWQQIAARQLTAVRDLALALVDLLEYLGGRGLVAANLQPGAILVGERSQPLLVDRCFLGPGSDLDPWFAGNVLAAAPEYFTDRCHDSASDRYALGGLLYQALTGTRPHRGLDPAEVASAMGRERPRPVREHRPTIPSKPAHAIDALLEPDRDARPTLEELREALRLMVN